VNGHEGGLFVKICGITRAEDAALAVGLGASALGFVFWKASPRYVERMAARAIIERQPPEVMKVGVFVDEPIDDLLRAVEDAALDAVQLHGHESREYCAEVLRTGTRVIKAIGLGDSGRSELDDVPLDVAILLDAHDPVRRGGTGRPIDWNRARAVAQSRKTILAGGLNADNVAMAVETVRPFGVDVSSGVESSPGVKDPGRMKRFFEALHD
jgi:phosphoribosylanthranilate isomerase